MCILTASRECANQLAGLFIECHLRKLILRTLPATSIDGIYIPSTIKSNAYALLNEVLTQKVYFNAKSDIFLTLFVNQIFSVDDTIY